MGQVSLGSLKFRLDPSSLSLGYKVKTAVTNTVGGRVIQVLGTSTDALTFTGSCGRGGYKEHRKLVENLIVLAERQLKDSGTPLKFVYPPEDWEFQVYLTAITGASGGPALSITPGQTDWGFRLSLFIVSDNANLKKAATDQFIKHFSVGIGWTPTEYNGIATYADLTAAEAEFKDSTTDTQGGNTGATPPTRDPDARRGG